MHPPISLKGIEPHYLSSISCILGCYITAAQMQAADVTSVTVPSGKDLCDYVCLVAHCLRSIHYLYTGGSHLMGLSCDNAVLILHTGDKTQNESLKPAYNLDCPSDLVGVFCSLIYGSQSC